jgi:hypothetical protein
MAVASVGNSGIYGQKGKALQGMFGGIGNASVNEPTSTNASFSTLNNPDGDGVNYRVGYWSSSGSFIVSRGGFADLLCVAGGGAGGLGISGYCAGGGGGGGIARLKKIYMPSGTYTITVGLGGSTGGAVGLNSIISGPFSNEITAYMATGGSGGAGGHGGGGSAGIVTGACITLSHTPGVGGGTGGGGSGGGGGGQGGNGGTGGTPGLGLLVSGWTTVAKTFSAGGGMGYGPTAGAANTGDGGYGGCGVAYAPGGSGAVYIRWIP